VAEITKFSAEILTIN